MNAHDIFASCKALEALAERNGFYRIEVCFRVNWIDSHPFTLSVEMRTRPDDYDSRVNTYLHTTDDPQQLFAEADLWINTQPNPHQIRQDKFLNDLGHLVEEAEFLELDPTPLREVFTAMTTNLLEHRA